MKNIIEQAARLIEDGAEALLESCCLDGVWDNPDDEALYREEVELARQLRNVAPLFQWRTPDDTPHSDEGWSRSYVVAVRRAWSPAAMEFPASYFKNHEIDHYPELGKTMSGNRWMHVRTDDRACLASGWHEYDDKGRGEPLLGPGDELLGWCEIPKWDKANDR